MRTTASTRSGTALFARYAYPPNDLGYCGPPGADVLLAGGAAHADDPEVRRRAEQFDGAWPYLQLIATAAGLDDPLDERVVSAYWVGGGPLGALDPDAFTTAVALGFGTQPGVLDRLAQTPDVAAAGAHHAFHVFVVYPWVGLLGSGSDVPRSVLDSCRVRWGTVVSVEGEIVAVRSQPLIFEGGVLGLGEEQVETVRWTQGRHAFVQEPRPGDWVSLHWDWVCDRLSEGEVAALAERTGRQLGATNAWLAQRHQ